MKKLILPLLAITAFVSLSACRTDRDDHRGPYVHHDQHVEVGGPAIEVGTDRRGTY